MLLSRRDLVRLHRGFQAVVAMVVLFALLAFSTHAATLSLNFTPVTAGTSVDLSAAGIDWAQWGLEGTESPNRKAGVVPLIGNPIVLGPNAAEAASDFPVLFNWSDGTPVTSGTNVTTALLVRGLNNGFQCSVPAGLLKRKLRVYAGCQATQANLQATLSDGSAVVPPNSSLSAVGGMAAGVYDLEYASASEGQTLTLSLTVAQSFDESVANVQLAAAILSTNIYPTVAIITPTNNSIFTVPANVTVTIDAQDSDGAISRVELYSGINPIAILTNAPYSFVMTNLPIGSYGLSARAFDNDGDQANSPLVSFSVISNMPPQVTLISPTNDANFSISDTIHLFATAQDPDGTIARVEWRVDNAKVGESLSEPYSLDLTNLSSGFHTIKAVAVDNYNAQKTSTPATIAVNTGLGSLGFTYGLAPLRVNLSTEGLRDWAHWGLFSETSFNHKAGVPSQIQNYSIIGHEPAYPYADNFTLYSWIGGTPVPTVTDTPTGVYVAGLGSGFEVRVAADTTIKTLKLYVGTFGARGRFTAHMSDFSTPVGFDSSLLNLENGPDAVYTVSYQASAPGQSLVLRYTVSEMHDSFGNVTLQAATLVSDNNPPSVDWVTPTNNSVFAAPANFTMEATATDNDGSVTNVEFFEGTTKLGEVLTPPYRFEWTNVPAGNYALTARAVDNKGATFSTLPVEVSVINGGGFLSGTFAPTPGQVNLTFEGRGDWAHWGYRTRNSFDHKRLVSQQVSNFVAMGSENTSQYSDNLSAFTWSDGTPTLNAAATRTGVYRPGISNGFELILPADPTLRRLKIYAGLYAARGRFEANLSDFSAARYLDNSLFNGGSSSVRTYTLYYAAASSNQTLRITYTSDLLFDLAYGNVTLQAATLAIVPQDLTLHVSKIGTNLFLTLPTEPSFGYSVEWADTLSPSWTVLTNFIATSAEVTITNIDIAAPARFYRARIE